jgi:FtsP/CotA-like multicopper oxidase with cupredoxin domain
MTLVRRPLLRCQEGRRVVVDLDNDTVADNPEPALFHCHQQLHTDFGFMALFRYA